MTWTPADVIRLVEVALWGFAIAAVPLATFITVIVGLRRSAATIKTVSNNVDRLEKNTNSISERNEAIAMRLGIADGVAQERASVLAHAALVAPLVPGVGTSPLPVADDRTAVASERSAAATERVADAAEEAGTSKKE